MPNLPRRHYAPGDTPADRKRRAERDAKAYDARRKTSAFFQFYHTPEWRRLRNAVLKRYPICVFCGKRAGHVDHIIPIRQDWARRLDPTNLRPLCHSCHSSHTLRERNAQR